MRCITFDPPIAQINDIFRQCLILKRFVVHSPEGISGTPLNDESHS
jgi:hypothetical protein